MVARWLALAAAALAVATLSACGGVGEAPAETAGTQLTVYSSLPLQGPTAAISKEIVGGEKLALSQAGGHVGQFRVSFTSLDDSNPQTGVAGPGEASTNAKEAAQDTSTIAYLGDYSSASTEISLPLINAAGILQTSTTSPYVGLTSTLDAGLDEPGRFYPSGKRNFVRLQPGDPVQAVAQARLMRSLGVHRVFVIDDQNAFQIPLATIVAEDAKHAGIDVAAHDSIAMEPSSQFAGEVEKVVHAGAQAVFVAAGAGEGAVALWNALHQADPRLLLLGPSALDVESFTSAISSGAAGQTYLSTPLLPLGSYPDAARRVLSAYRSTFGSEGGAESLYGYEAMSLVLEAIRKAGPRGNNRQAVIQNVFSMRNRSSVLGRYSIEPNGETTLSVYAVDRIRGGQPVFLRTIDTVQPTG